MTDFMVIRFLEQQKQELLLIPYSINYFTALHVKFSTPFYSSQLVDMFSYEKPFSKKTPNTGISNLEQSPLAIILVYNFHNLLTQKRLFIFSLKQNKKLLYKTISEIFNNANWLEREVSELYGLIFEGKSDTRNLMLQYGDSFNPFQKFFPSIGIKEMFFNIITDFLMEWRVHCQS